VTTDQSTATKTRWTQAELLAEAMARFGSIDAIAFVCPTCGDRATIADFKQVGKPELAGQECIGRSLGALAGPAVKDGRGQATRGCDWAAFGLFRGPWTIVMPASDDKPERDVYSFALAPAVPDAAE